MNSDRRVWMDLVRLSDQLKLVLREGSVLTQAAGLCQGVSFRVTGDGRLRELEKSFDALEGQLRATLQMYARACDSLETLGAGGPRELGSRLAPAEIAAHDQRV